MPPLFQWRPLCVPREGSPGPQPCLPSLTVSGASLGVRLIWAKEVSSTRKHVCPGRDQVGEGPACSVDHWLNTPRTCLLPSSFYQGGFSRDQVSLGIRTNSEDTWHESPGWLAMLLEPKMSISWGVAQW